MSDVLVIKGEIEEDTVPWFFRRVVDGMGTPLVRADIVPNGITLRVYDLSEDPNTAVLTQSGLDPSTTTSGPGIIIMQDTLGTTGWTKDNDGYQFFHCPNISAMSPAMRGGHHYRFEYELELESSVGGGTGWVNFEVKVRPQKSA